MTQPSNVLITGGGPTGLTLALWLTKLGVPVRIVDRLPEAAPYSRALGVQARTLELYRQLDGPGIHLAEEVVERGLKVGGVNFWTGGRKAAHIPLRSLGEGLTPFPFVLTFAQDAHERLLLEHLEALGVRVERATELVRFEQDSGGVRAVLRHASGAEETCEAAYLAGCDGAHSAVREALGTTFAGGTYSRLFYVADVNASGPAINGEIHVELDEADLLALFPMDENGRVRLVGTMRDDASVIPAAREGPVRSGGDTPPATAPSGASLGFGVTEPRFEDVSDRAIERLQLTVAQVHWFSTYRVHHRVAGRFREGRAFLLGDAAHIHSPVGAQGMNTGIGDAANLAWKLAAVLHGDAPDELLDTYEQERIAFARRLVHTTDRIFTFASKRGRLAAWIRTALVPRLAPLLFRLPALRRFVFRTVSQLGIDYRQSSLSEGRAGRIHGGDRLPWVPLSASQDNFTFVSTLRWQVHIYGEARPGLAEGCAALDLPLHVFPWSDAMREAGLARGALYVVRPDSYIGLADAGGDPERLRAYIARQRSNG